MDSPIRGIDIGTRKKNISQNIQINSTVPKKMAAKYAVQKTIRVVHMVTKAYISYRMGKYIQGGHFRGSPSHLS